MLAQDQLIGTRFEKCVVERLIGRGGYGLTFLAFDEELQEHRVVKVSQNFSMDEAQKRRHLKSFLEEGLILSRLKHPQIVTLRGQGDKHGHRYMILDYIQGFSLRQVLDIVAFRREELGCAWTDLMDPATASALVLSSLYPLEYAHRANVHLPDREIFGVAHRDIAPGNLILGVKGNEKGRLILIDFGTAKTELTENITVDQNLVGTVPYMGKARLQKANSPEQMAQYKDFWKEFRETQHDIHALGVLYYQLLTGRLPFPGETTPQIIVKILDPECYSQCQLEIASAHPQAAAVLRKCLVYHDFSMPLSQQPYQYPDAAAMLPDFVAMFDAVAGGRSVNELLVALGKNLARPESWEPGPARESAGRPPSTDANSVKILHPASILPYRTESVLPRVLFYAIVVIAGIALALWAYTTLRPGGKTTGAAVARTPGMPSKTVSGLENTPALERLDGIPEPDPAKASSPSKAGSKTKVTSALPRNTAAPAKPAKLPASNRKAKETSLGTRRHEVASEASDTKAILPAATPQPPASQIQAPSNQPAELNKEEFVQLQTLVREEDASALEKISDLLKRSPESPDLRFLKCQLVLRGNPASTETRNDLASLASSRPAFMHPTLFHEGVLYSLWKVDENLYEAQKTPANRINLLKSSNTYLSEFQANPAYDAKVRAIQSRMPL